MVVLQFYVIISESTCINSLYNKDKDLAIDTHMHRDRGRDG